MLQEIDTHLFVLESDFKYRDEHEETEPLPRQTDSYQVKNNFTVRVGLELVRFLQQLAQRNMVVDLSVDTQNQTFVAVGQGLCTAL